MPLDPVESVWSVATVVLGGAVTWCVARLNEQARRQRREAEEARARERAVEEGLLSILRTQLVDAYETYVLGDKPLSVERRSEIDKCFSAYEGLGGNGTGAALYREICAVPVTTVHAALGGAADRKGTE